MSRRAPHGLQLPLPGLPARVRQRLCVGILVPADAFSFSRGAPKYHVGTAESGRSVGRGFCAECGSPVAATQAGNPIVIIYASSLDDPSWHRPTLDIFTSSAQPWDHLNPELPKFPRGLE